MKKSPPFLSIAIAIYFGAIFPIIIIHHQQEHLKEYSQFLKHDAHFHSKDFSGEEINVVHKHLFDFQCIICNALEKKKKFIYSGNVYLAHIDTIHDLKTLTPKPFFESILFRFAPPLRGPPLA